MNRLLVLAAILALGLASEVDRKNTVKVSVFYESYCPFSDDFFVSQLYPTWSKYKQHITLDLVPFGQATQSYNPTTGKYTFTCVHGPNECVCNIMHSCAIYEACGAKGTLHCPMAKLTKVMKYLNCVIKQNDQRGSSNKCATKNGLNPKAINKCTKGKQGQLLESKYGNETAAFNNPKVSYVPFIAFNNKHTEATNLAAQGNLKKLLCHKYIKC